MTASSRFRLHFAGALTATLILASPILFAAQAGEKEKEEEETIVLSPFEVSAGPSAGYSATTTMAGTRISTPLSNVSSSVSTVTSQFLGATPGGAQDINFFRMGAGRGLIPHPDTFTAEGLFSEHDLPLDLEGKPERLLCVQTAAVPAQLEVLPEVRYLAQLGFSSGLRADAFQPAPLNLVAVVDKSGSMNGEPLALVRASLQSALGHMRDGDQLTIVVFGDESHVHLPPTAISGETRASVRDRINAIESSGSTWMEAGLRLGYEVAAQTQATFRGTTRVMLFTDEQPNVGDTSAEGFMAMAAAASYEGIGLTTIGVGVEFGAELATEISSMRGGNLYFFPDGAEMRKTFAEDFDTMVTELAHDFSVRIAPAPGLRLAGVFGLPADLLRWDGDALVLDVATIFLSRRKGAIYFALAPEPAGTHLPGRAVRAGQPLAEVDFNYRDARDDVPVSEKAPCRLVAPGPAQVGLTRGPRLIDEYLTLKKAAQVHLFDNDQERAFRLVSGLLARLDATPDAALEPERRLVRDIHNTLALLSGHAGEILPDQDGKRVSPLLGVWRSREAGGLDGGEYLVVWPNGVVEAMAVNPEDGEIDRLDSIALDGPLPTATRGRLPLSEGDKDKFETVRYELSRGKLTLDFGSWIDGPARLVFERCRYADIPRAGEPELEPAVDEFSGLPVVEAR